MKFIDIIASAKSAGALVDSNTEETTALLTSQVNTLLDRIRALPADHDPLERAQMQLDTARNLVLLDEGAQACARGLRYFRQGARLGKGRRMLRHAVSLGS